MEGSGYVIQSQTNTHIYLIIIAVFSFLIILIFNWIFVYNPVSKINKTVNDTSKTINTVIARTNLLEDKIDTAKDAAEKEFEKVKCSICTIIEGLPGHIPKPAFCDDCPPTS